MDEYSVQVETVPGAVGSVVIKVTGPTDITNISSLLLHLMDAFERAESISIDLSGVTKIDVAGLQLFCSSHRSSIFANKGFRITGQNQPAIWEAARTSGQLRTIGCAFDTQHSCIWTGGTA